MADPAKKTILTLLLPLFLLTYCVSKNIGYADRDVRCSLAGSGDPWGALTKDRLRIMLALHDSLDLGELVEDFEMPEDQLLAEIDPLVEVSLVRREDGGHRPAVFVANGDEVERVYLFAGKQGIDLASAIVGKWEQLADSFSRLSIAGDFTLRDKGFLLVGSRILDIGLLQLLYDDATLMTKPPHRPSPARPDARYYFWILETSQHEHLGKYGEEDTDLKWENWHLLDFGQTVVDGKINRNRINFQERAAGLIEDDLSDNPGSLAAELGISFLSIADSRIWNDTADQVARKLLPVILDEGSKIRDYYATLKASTYTNNSFGEFFCWYYHLVYVAAIDELARKNLIDLPKELHSGVIMYIEKRVAGY